MTKGLPFLVLTLCAAIHLASCGGSGNPPPNRPPAGIITSPATDVTIAPGASVNLQSSCTDPDGDSVTHIWGLPNGTASTLQNPGNLTFPDPGVFMVSYTCTDSKGLDDPTRTRGPSPSAPRGCSCSAGRSPSTRFL